MFVAALYESNDGDQAIRDYVASVHGPGSNCPHPRVLPNLVSICVGAIFHRQVSPKVIMQLGSRVVNQTRCLNVSLIPISQVRGVESRVVERGGAAVIAAVAVLLACLEYRVSVINELVNELLASGPLCSAL